jgi:predicted phage-related endonuclease
MSEPAREVREIESTGAWLDWRREDLTASRIPALWNLHPYLSREQLVDIMRADTSAGSGTPPDNAAMRRGRIFEAAVAAAIAEERPEWTLAKATTYHRIPSLRIGCTPDYFATSTLPKEPGRGIIQIKTAAPRVWERWQGRAPLPYIIQTLTEAVVCECAWAWLVIMVMSDSYPVHYFAVPRHAEAETRILVAATKWWREFDAGELPGTAAGASELAADFDDGSWIDLSADNALPGLLDERASLKATTSDAERRLKEIDYEIKNRMGRASRAWLPGWDISFATQHRKEVLLAARDIRVLRVRATEEQEAPDAAG